MLQRKPEQAWGKRTLPSPWETPLPESGRGPGRTGLGMWRDIKDQGGWAGPMPGRGQERVPSQRW